jgi:hypothetical protein
MDTTLLGHVIAEYFDYKGQPLHRGPNSNGIYTIKVADGLVLGAGLVRNGGFELFAQAGYVDGDTLREIVEDDEEGDTLDLEGHERTAVPGPFMRWEASDAEWFIDLDRHSGRITLSSIHTEVPRHLAGLMAVLDMFRTVHFEWAGRLETVPVADQPSHYALTAQPAYDGFLQV